jgi:hypothetical protein
LAHHNLQDAATAITAQLAIREPRKNFGQAGVGQLERQKDRHSFAVPPPFISQAHTPDRPSTPQNADVTRIPRDKAREQSKAAGYSRIWRDSQSGVGEKRWSIGGERSNTHAPVEKSIEATLAKSEINTRSRKASHSLSLFKEATAPHDAKSREERVKDKQIKDKAKEWKVPESRALEGHAQVSSYAQNSIQSLQDGDSQEDGHLIPLSNNIQSAAEKTWNTSEKGGGRDLASSRRCRVSPLSDTFNKPSPNRESGPGSVIDIGAQATQPLPTRLLEQMHEYHNLTSGAEKRTSFSRSIPATVSGRSTPPPIHRTLDSEPPKPVYYGEIDQAHSTSDRSLGEEDDDSEKDEISSALYIPHQTPIEPRLTKLDGKETRHDTTWKPPRTPMRDAQEYLEEHEIVSTGDDIDISLRAEGTEQHLHGDFHASHKVPSRETELYDSNWSDTAPQSQPSESEYDSVDEIARSVVDEDDTTYAATPRPSHLQQHMKHHRQEGPPVPLDAIELKPYSHQVGGHTTVFRFSRRAVCKSLNNRENEFYETVERRHRDLLPFLPRYV